MIVFAICAQHKALLSNFLKNNIFFLNSFLKCWKFWFKHSYVFAGNLPSWNLLMYLQEIFLRGSFLCICRKSPSWKLLMYLQEIFLCGSFLCIYRKSSFVEASYIFAGNLPAWKPHVFTGHLHSWKLLMYLQEIALRGSFWCICRKSSFVEASYVFTGNLPAWKLLMYLQEDFFPGSFLCICRKSFFVEASYVFAGSLPSWKFLISLQDIFLRGSFSFICRKSSDSIIQIWAHRFCEIALSKFSENFLRGIFTINKVAGLQGLRCNFIENELFNGTIFYE